MPSEVKKTMKNEGGEDEEDENSLSSSVKMAKKKKPMKKEKVETEKDEGTPNGFIKDKKTKKKSINGSAEALIKTSKVNKEEPKDEDSDEDDEPATKKTKRKKKMLLKEEDKRVVAAEANGKKKGRKVFDLPGQKRDPPEERDPLRIFYETLYKQLPDSEMAAMWMMESGLLPRDVAMKVYEKKQKNHQQKLSSPIKAITSVKKITKSVTVNKTTKSVTVKNNSGSKPVVKNSKKRKMTDSASENESNDDFVAAKPKSKKCKT